MERRGNSACAIVAARRLHNYGADVAVLTSRSDDAFTAVSADQPSIVRRMGIAAGSTADPSSIDQPAVILDGMIGYSLRGAPRGDTARLIEWANASAPPVLSMDAPSGVDTTTGVAHDPAILATATMTLALPKMGLREPGVVDNVGDLDPAHISVPPELYAAALGLTVGPVFAQSDIVHLV